jgi:hypothetical protein
LIVQLRGDVETVIQSLGMISMDVEETIDAIKYLANRANMNQIEELNIGYLSSLEDMTLQTTKNVTPSVPN